ncbi:MAG: hypothetical protein QGH99_12575 [Pseudomonadales bacterium]|jgi:hypothetical protein|nr:hypothetical protein [Pseudomonadales bacterium]MDP7314193.1 hypothetical protein [Pseudomonadales bacterium]MDP7577784.1 hypothetical protein [Pseudomonadales bacterium]HJP51656.1 hypothetical protein [Pseudomonadales bacterium]|tara:strand:+ start:865 stop:1482 length:618 start_codon:yes stop_codon:yes gene_type:complete
MANTEVSLENDPTPLVKIFANKFLKSLDHAKYASKVNRFHGTFALASTTSPQSITIDIRNSKIFICRGIQDTAKIVIRTDFDNPSKQKVEGLLLHPLLAMKISRLLDFPQANWIDAAKQFWEKNVEYPGMPTGIEIHCEDESREYTLGEDPDVYITGRSNNIAEVFAGDAVLVESLMLKKLSGVSSFEHAVVLSDVTVQMMLGNR